MKNEKKQTCLSAGEFVLLGQDMIFFPQRLLSIQYTASSCHLVGKTTQLRMLCEHTKGIFNDMQIAARSIHGLCFIQATILRASRL